MSSRFRFGVVLVAGLLAATPALAQQNPNILVIWGDDIGTWNISHNNRGMMGYETPNMDRIANEGILFTNCYAQQSCTAGRAAFVTGQSPIRTGLLRVGLPGADLEPSWPDRAEGRDRVHRRAAGSLCLCGPRPR